MSTPSRASRGGPGAPRVSSRGAMNRGARSSRGYTPARSNSGASTTANLSQTTKAEGFLEGLKSGRGRGRGRGPSNTRGSLSNAHRTSNGAHNVSTFRSASPTGARPTTANDYMNQMLDKYNSLKSARDQERAKAIRDGFLADPEKKTTLDQAITPVGTCTEMCPEFERLQRIVQNAVDRTEKAHDEVIGRDMPAEDRMVKRFRRSAAGDDEQLPSDIRTPATLKRSLDYLINEVIGEGENLATVHKFVWDRTRSIRNDFSIQQVSKSEDVALAVECFERIARFHILALHQLSNPDNLQGGNFDAHQEREQLNNTLLSLMYYYDDYRDRQGFKNEPEFRAYCIVLEMQATHPDLEDRMQAWPKRLLQSPAVQNAFELHAAASNTLIDQGPLKPTTPFLVAQSNYEGFWKRMKSLQTSYLLACLAESHFGQIRFIALQNIWNSNKKAPLGQQKQNRQWNLDELTGTLAFDDYDQTKEFCESFGLGFQDDSEDLEYLDFMSLSSDSLEPYTGMNRQVFSHDVVEKKRFWRTFAAVINGVTVAEAIKQGMVVQGPDNGPEEYDEGVENQDSLFIPEKSTVHQVAPTKTTTSVFNPSANPFKPGGAMQGADSKPAASSIFGQPTVATQSASTSTGIFGQPSVPQNKSTGMFGVPSTSQPSTPSTFGQPTPGPSIFGKPTSFPKIENQQSAWATTSKPDNEPSSTAAFKWGSSSGTISKVSSSSATPFTWPSNSAPSLFGKPSDNSRISDRAAVSPSTSTAEPPLNTASANPIENQSSPSTRSSNATLELGSESIRPPPSPRPGKRELPEEVQSAPQSSPPKASTILQPSESPTNLPSKGEVQPTSFSRAFVPQTSSLLSPSTASPSTSSVHSKPEILSPQPLKPLSSRSTPLSTERSTESEDAPNLSASAPSAPSSTQTFSFTPVKSSIPATFTPAAPPPRFKPDPRPRLSSPLSRPPETVPLSPETKGAIQQPSENKVRSSFSPSDSEKLSETVARLGLVEEHGLLQQFVEYKTVKIVEAAIKQFEKEETDRLVASFRFQLLVRKYGSHWRELAYRKKLNRRAKHRRSIFAQTLREEKMKKQRGDEELQAILKAKREKEEIQAAQHRESLERSLDQISGRSAIVGPFDTVQPMAGKKRKSLPMESSDSFVPTKIPSFSTGHKRSRTVGGIENGQATDHRISKPSDHSPHRPLTSSMFLGRSILLDYPDSAEIQAAARNRKVDRTNTDYFRLKARGIDPSTSVIPHTKESLDRKRRRDDDESEGAMPVATWSERRKRTSMMTERMNPLLAKVLQTKVSVSPGATQSTRSVSRPRSTPTSPPSSERPSIPGQYQDANDEDDLLRQIREVRSAMSHDTDWFKEQASKIEEEERRSSEISSTSEQQRAVQIPTFSDSIFGERVNGYQFAPSASASLSRSEQRLRRTGGYGLANKAVEDYLPGGSRYMPAMSKKSAAAFLESISSQETAGQPAAKKRNKGKRKVVDPTYRYSSDKDITDEMVSYKRPKVTERGRSPKAMEQTQLADNEEELLFDENADEADYVQQRYNDVAATGVSDGQEFAEGGYDEDEPKQYQDPDIGANDYGDEERTDEDEDEDEDEEVLLDEEEEQYENEEGEEEYYAEEEEAGYEEGDDDEQEENGSDIDDDDDADEEEDQPPFEGTGYEDPDPGFTRSGSSRSVSQGLGIAGTGATQEDALVLSD